MNNQDNDGVVIIRDENVLKKLNPPQIDVSHRALRIARMIDRLPSGDYVIELSKQDIRQAPWDMCAWKRERVQKQRLTG